MNGAQDYSGQIVLHRQNKFSNQFAVVGRVDKPSIWGNLLGFRYHYNSAYVLLS
ncbi:MAG: hypothetical protein ACXW00_02655 [Methylobacter sp.]